MSRKKISTTIYVTPEQSDKLKLLHERTKVPVAVYIREGIDLVLKHYAHLLPGQLPLDATPPRGLSRVDARAEGRTGEAREPRAERHAEKDRASSSKLEAAVPLREREPGARESSIREGSRESARESGREIAKDAGRDAIKDEDEQAAGGARK